MASSYAVVKIGTPHEADVCRRGKMSQASQLLMGTAFALSLLVAVACTQTSLVVKGGDAGSPESRVAPLPSASPVLEANFDPIDPDAAPAGHHHHHHGHHSQPEPKKEASP